MISVNKYAQTQKETASKERLMVLLFEAALKHMRKGAEALEKGRAQEATPSLERATDIVFELHRTLDKTQIPELGEQLSSVYEFVAARLTQAKFGHNPKLAREAERAFAPLVDGFSQAVASLAQAGASR
jgi:flagellar protein FliS